jgi:hypothetical protein
MDSSQAQIIVSVSGHWLVGILPSHGERIQDILRDKNQEFVTLHEVQICRPTEGEWCRATLTRTLVPRDKIEFVISPNSRHEAPIKRYHNFAARQTANCLVTIKEYCIQGEVHVPVLHDDTTHTFVHQLGSFFPLTNICLNTTGLEQLTAPVLFVNKQHVSCFYLGPLLVQDPPPVEQTAKSTEAVVETGIDSLLAMIDSCKNDSPPQFSEVR